MDISKLEEGQVIKNYKELCSILNIPVVTGGNQRAAQLKTLDTFVRYSKKGHKFIIEEIFNAPIERVDLRTKNSPYIDNMNKLILCLLKKTDGNTGYLSINSLLYFTDVVNNNYLNGRNNNDIITDYLKIDDPFFVKEFYDKYHNMFYSMVVRSLNKLRDNHIIHFEERDTLLFPNGSVRLVTDDDIAKILDIKTEIMYSLGCCSDEELTERKLKRKFNSLVSIKICKTFGAEVIFKSFKIIWGTKSVERELEKYNKREIRELLKESILMNIDLKAKTTFLPQNIFGRIPEAILNQKQTEYDNTISIANLVINSNSTDLFVRC